MKRLALAVALSLTLTGCLSNFLNRERTAYCAQNPSASQCVEVVPFSVQFYAAVGDYNAAKSAAAAYAEAPTTHSSHIEYILLVVEEADTIMKQVVDARASGQVTPDLYAEGAAALRRAVLYLRAYVADQAAKEPKS